MVENCHEDDFIKGWRLEGKFFAVHKQFIFDGDHGGAFLNSKIENTLRQIFLVLSIPAADIEHEISFLDVSLQPTLHESNHFIVEIESKAIVGLFDIFNFYLNRR